MSAARGNVLPEKIGHYKVVSELGRGGMGVVYKAHEESLNRFVAIKVLGDHLSTDEQFLSRFTREARAAGGVSHPNVIPIYFIGEDNGQHYFAMEYVSGRSVQQMIRQEGRIGNPRAAQIILQAAQGLAAAHDRGVIHRDIKPANLMVDDRGVVKIADFGIALPVEAQTRLTATGALMGTPGYLSPEHCMGEQVDHRADIYALGVTYFEMLTGRMPFNAESPLALLRQILQEEVPDVTQLNSEVDAESKRILMKMIARDRNARYQSCHELVSDLEEYLAKHNVRSLTANLASRSTASADAASTPTVATPAAAASSAPTALVGGSSQAPTVITGGPGATSPMTAPGAMKPAAVTAPGGTPFTAPATNPGQRAAAPPQAQQQPKKKSSFAAFAAVLIVAVVVAAGAAGLIGYKLYKGSIFGPAKTNEASVLPAVGSTQPSSSPAKSVSPEKVDLANTNPTALNALTSTQPIDSQTQSQQQAQTQQTSQQQSNVAVDVKGGTQQVASAGTNPVQQRSSKRVQSSQERGGSVSAPHLSNIVYDVQGDPAVAGPLADVLSSEFSEFKAESVENVNDRLAGAPASDLCQRLYGKAGIVVVARVEPAGQREIYYMGRYDTVYGSRITMTAYDVATGKPIGPRVSGNMESTQLNIQQKTEQTAGALARKIVEQIQNR